MFKASRVILPGALVALIGAQSCDYQEVEPGPQYSSAAEQLAAEFGEGVSQDAVDRVVVVSKDLVLESRGRGISDLITNLKAHLALRGIDGKVLDGIIDSTLGDPLPGVNLAQSGGTGSVTQPLTPNNPNKQHYECPPMNLTGTKESCVQLLDAVITKTEKSVTKTEFHARAAQKIQADNEIMAQPQSFQDQAKEYLGDLTANVYQFGVDVAAIRAEYTLRDAGLCDAELVDGKEIARMRGIEEAEEILRQMIGRSNMTLAPQGGECLRIGQAGAQTKALIDAAVKKWIEDEPLCPDTSRSNANVQDAEKYRKDGIDHGIQALTTSIWVGTIRNGVPYGLTEYIVVKVDNCTPKDQIRYTTSPLVVDLDGDGLDLSTDRVTFDLLATGQPQKVTWPGPTEGLLALDLNGDGRVTSGRELFGNRSDCAGGKCADGAAALAAHDDNADGKIDRKDAVFGSLRIWVDRNHDGQSQPAEVAPLTDHGIQSLSLKASYFERKVPAGRISLSLTVETKAGPRTAYDVWFDNLVAPGFPTPLD